MAFDSKRDAGKRKRSRIVRGAVLAAVLVFVTALGLLHQYGGVVKPVGVDALCPFGAIESAWSLISAGSLLSKIAWSSFALLAAVLLTAVLFRRSFCGKLCPLGALQEGAGWLGKKLLGRRFKLHLLLDRAARWLKYAVLAVIIIMTAITGTLFIRPYDPWATWMHLASVELFTGFLVGFIVLILSLAGSFFYDRFFCKYLCPMGAVLSPFGRLGLFKVKRDPSACIDCKACDKACPMNIEVSKAEKVKTGECIDCHLCVDACPVSGALGVEGPAKKKASPLFITLASAGIFIALMLVARFTGLVAVTQESIETRFSASTAELPEASPPAADQGAPAEADSAALEARALRAEEVSSAIKGSDSWEGVIAASGIPAQTFKDRFNLSDSQLSGQLRVQAHDPSFGADMEGIRAFVKEEMLAR